MELDFTIITYEKSRTEAHSYTSRNSAVAFYKARCKRALEHKYPIPELHLTTESLWCPRTLQFR